MPKLTLLEIVTDILNDLDSDEVNSINDTVEAQQIAQIVKTTYFHIVEGRDWPHLNTLFQMEASGTGARPTHMRLPENAENVSWLKYNIRNSTDTKDNYREVVYKTPEEFLDMLDLRNSSNTNISVISDTSGVTLNIITDAPPTYFTSFDDEYLVFDSYDSVVDSTLQSSKTKCYGKRIPIFTIADAFIPDLPIQMFSYLKAEAKSVAFLALKQATNAKAEQQSVTGRRRMSQEAWRVKKGISYPNYGRK